VGFWVKSKYNTLVSGAAGNPLAVEIFEQWNGIFAGNAGELLKSGHGDSLALRLPKLGNFLAHFEEGVAHFNAREFWHAHESWEILWLEADSDLVEFLQGMIQLAAAYHHLQRGTPRGAVRLIDAALRRLEPFPAAFSYLFATNFLRQFA